MKISVLDVVIDFQPLEEALLHVARAESQTVADIIEQQARALRKKPANEKGLKGNIVYAGLFLHGEQIKNISMNDKEGVRATIPAAGQFEPPAAQR